MNALEQVEVDIREPEVLIRFMLTFDRAADDHLGDCARRGFTPRTLASYGRTYRLFGDWLPREMDVSKVTSDDINRFLGAHAHLAPGTVSGFESHFNSLFSALYKGRKITRNPMDLLTRTKRKRPEDLDVVTVSSADVRALLGAGRTWTEKLAPAMPAYLGPRRHAVATARLTDLDRRELPVEMEDGMIEMVRAWRMRFREKGNKIIWKPVPDELAMLILAAEADGAYEKYDYIVPPEGNLSRKGERDDRVIWRVINRLADRVGIRCHVHALRGAFACFYDECNPGQVLALRDLLGHASVQTTELYLRRRDKQAGMESVRTLSWGMGEERFERSEAVPTGLQPAPALQLRRSPDVALLSESPPTFLQFLRDGQTDDLEPPQSESSMLERAGSVNLESALHEAAVQAVSGDEPRPSEEPSEVPS